jgi:TetR/AcrR family transcriptional repressor of nem operon
VAAGRPKEFVKEEVLERAMDLFWREGYHGAGIAELLPHMGIARQSLYDTFGSKRDLFVAVIGHYRGTRLVEVLEILGRRGPGLVAVREAVGFFEQLAVDKRGRGCLVANALVEMGTQDAEIAALLKETLGLLEAGYRKALARARRQGELGAGKSPAKLAMALTNASIGLAVTGRLAMGDAAIASIYEGTLSMLD